MPGDRYSSPARTGAWRIEDEEHREIASELRAERGSTRLLSAPLEHPGLYRVLHDGQLRASFAVNPDARESDLEPHEDAALLSRFPGGRATILRGGENLAQRVKEARYGRELWSWFVWLALGLLIAETIIARWGMSGPRTPQP